MLFKINNYFEVLGESCFKMQVILLDLHLFPASWSLGQGVGGLRRHEGIRNIPDLPTSLPSSPGWQTESFLKSSLCKTPFLLSHLPIIPSSSLHSQEPPTGLALPHGSHSLPPLLASPLKIRSISFSPWLTLCDSMSSCHTQQTLTEGPDNRVKCPQTLLLPAFWLSTLAKEEGGKNNHNSLTVTMNGPAEVLTDFKHWRKKK